MVKQVLATPSLYFSYTYDLTESLQRLYSNGPEYLKVGQGLVISREEFYPVVKKKLDKYVKISMRETKGKN